MNTEKPEKSDHVTGVDETVSPQEKHTDRNGILPKIISFDSLARCGEEIWIENNGQVYRLRRTRQQKLILTK